MQNVQLKEMQRSLSKGLVADVIDLHFESIDAKILSDCLAGKCYNSINVFESRKN